MNSYRAFDNFLVSKPSRNVPSIRSTQVRRLESGDIALVYHYTPVVIAHQDGTFTLYTGGWRTPTTKARINDFSPARVFQRKGVWYLNWRLADGDSGSNARFYDGIRVDADGVPVEVAK